MELLEFLGHHAVVGAELAAWDGVDALGDADGWDVLDDSRGQDSSLVLFLSFTSSAVDPSSGEHLFFESFRCLDRRCRFICVG